MFRKLFSSFVVVTLFATVFCSVVTDDAQTQTNQNNASPGLRSILRIYDECQRSDGGMSMCLKKKAVTFVDRLSKIDVINIGDDVKVVGVEGTPTIKSRSLNENDLEQMLPRSLEDRDYFLTNMLTEKLANYLSGRKIQISLPQMTPTDLGRGLEEGKFFSQMNNFQSSSIVGILCQKSFISIHLNAMVILCRIPI